MSLVDDPSPDGLLRHDQVVLGEQLGEEGMFNGMYCSQPIILKLAKDDDDDDGIWRETSVMSKLLHPAVQRVFGMWAEQDNRFGRIFMVMDTYHCDLSTLIRRPMEEVS